MTGVLNGLNAGVVLLREMGGCCLHSECVLTEFGVYVGLNVGSVIRSEYGEGVGVCPHLGCVVIGVEFVGLNVGDVFHNVV